MEALWSRVIAGYGTTARKARAEGIASGWTLSGWAVNRGGFDESAEESERWDDRAGSVALDSSAFGSVTLRAAVRQSISALLRF